MNVGANKSHNLEKNLNNLTQMSILMYCVSMLEFRSTYIKKKSCSTWGNSVLKIAQIAFVKNLLKTCSWINKKS